MNLSKIMTGYDDQSQWGEVACEVVFLIIMQRHFVETFIELHSGIGMNI